MPLYTSYQVSNYVYHYHLTHKMPTFSVKDSSAVKDLKYIPIVLKLLKMAKENTTPFYAIMMTSSNGNIFRITGLCVWNLLAFCVGNSTVTSKFPTQRLVTQSFDVFFDLCLNKTLSKQSWGWWFETPSCSSWCHCNGWPHLCMMAWPTMALGPCLNIKTVFPKYGDSHFKDKKVTIPSYL